MKIEHNGHEFETVRELTEEKKGKAKFVGEFIRPLLWAVNPDIEDVCYEDCENGPELVVVWYDRNREYYETVNVTADSWKGIAYDVVKQIC